MSWFKNSPNEKELSRLGNLRFWETADIPLPLANMNTYFSLRAKCWLKGGVGRQFQFQQR